MWVGHPPPCRYPSFSPLPPSQRGQGAGTALGELPPYFMARAGTCGSRPFAQWVLYYLQLFSMHSYMHTNFYTDQCL